MITEFVTWQTLRTPVIMTNLYPFLMGNAALKHEKIPYFPTVDKPENHILVAHCGFLGVIPQSWATEWTLRPPVLEIVDPNAHAIDARLPEGQMTIVKIASTMDTLDRDPGRADQLPAVRELRLPERRGAAGGRRLPVRGGPALAPRGDRDRRHRRRLEVVGPVLGLGIEHI